MKKGKISTTGYRADSKDKNNAFNIIPTNRISMQNVEFPVVGEDDLGNRKLMMPGEEHIFPGQFVKETPVNMKKNNSKKSVSRKVGMIMFQQGGAPQQGGQDQIMQQVAQALQQGTPPEQIMQGLIQQGIPQDQAQQVIQAVMQQMQGGAPMMQDGGTNPYTVTPVSNVSINETPFYSTDKDYQKTGEFYFGVQSGKQPNDQQNAMIRDYSLPVHQTGINSALYTTFNGADIKGQQDRLVAQQNSIWNRSKFKQGGEPCYDCAPPGYHMMPDGSIMPNDKMQAGGDWISSAVNPDHKGRCTPGSPNYDCPKNSPQWHLAQTFKQMAKKQFGGTSAVQNSDQDSIIDKRKNTMQTFLSRNTMNALAVDEADNVANAFMQMGGNFGFNPNLNNQNQWMGAMENSQNQMRNDVGQFGANSYNMGMGIMRGNMMFRDQQEKDYYRSQIKDPNAPMSQGNPMDNSMVTPNIEVSGIDYSQSFASQMRRGGRVRKFQPGGIMLRGDGTKVYIDGSSSTGRGGTESDITIVNPSNASTNNGSSANGYVTPNTNRGSSSPSGNVANECESLFNTQAEIDACIAQRNGQTIVPAATTTTTSNGTVIRGNANDPVANNVPQNGTYQTQPDGSLVFISGQQPYGYFPMNSNPYYKMKGRGPMWGSTGVPNIAYNPNDTYLKDYEYKGRFLGPGPRKVKMTFQHGVPTAVDENGNVVNQNTTTNTNVDSTGQPTSPTGTLDQYLQNNMDPALYDLRLNGQGSPQDIIDFNTEKARLEAEYNNSPLRQLGPVGSTLKKPNPFFDKFKGKLQNVQQNMQERGNNRFNRRNPPQRESGVHPGFAQDGGAQLNNFDDPNRYNNGQGFFGRNNQNESTVVWKRKMGLDPENAVAWGISGMDALSSFAEARDARKQEEEYRKRMNADALFYSNQWGDTSRGDYDTNTGMLRPNDNVPVQFQGNNTGRIGSNTYMKQGGSMPYKNGGEYYLTDEEIAYIKKCGGTVKHLD